MAEITELGLLTGDPKMTSPKQLLEFALRDIGMDGALINGKKMLIIALDDSEQDSYFHTNYIAGMEKSEVIALLEITKTRILMES